MENKQKVKDALEVINAEISGLNESERAELFKQIYDDFVINRTKQDARIWISD